MIRLPNVFERFKASIVDTAVTLSIRCLVVSLCFFVLIRPEIVRVDTLMFEKFGLRMSQIMHNQSNDYSEVINQSNLVAYMMDSLLFIWAAGAIYYISMLTRTGTTIGLKRINAGIRVMNDLSKPSFWRISLRYFLSLVPIILPAPILYFLSIKSFNPLFFGCVLLWIMWSDSGFYWGFFRKSRVKRPLHDIICGTVITKLS